MKKAVDLLVKDLKVCTLEETVSRIFFISANEVLQARINRNVSPLHSGTSAEGFDARYKDEFEEFERKLKDCLTKYAIKAKFLNNSKEGKHVIE